MMTGDVEEGGRNEEVRRKGRHGEAKDDVLKTKRRKGEEILGE